MSQSQFTFKQGLSTEVEPFPHILGFGLKKNNTIQLDSFVPSRFDHLQFYFIVEGKFEWIINGRYQVLYPGDIAVVLPGHEIGGAKGYFGIGSFFWLQLEVGNMAKDGVLNLGRWSSLSPNESETIGKILLRSQMPLVKAKDASNILNEMRLEVESREIGFITRINHLLDSLLIIIARQSTRQANSHRDFPQTFMKVEEALRKNLSHQWTVEEMAAIIGLGTTAFTEKVKSHTGFPPLHYLINIRISTALNLLKQDQVNITDIALRTGFYSSQHFSTTFKKLTGLTPKEFRKTSTIEQYH